ncbi:hypothetical protein CFIO01_07020 [Colletotrichum fioriniae PJ7]|uniref:Uncharacterized protein n=1 Tax=Colletotrichum fioriniae PJ7 TaxID=1445577 RepID=A0A010RXZ5_9PEZI|nr:hypothetical protein CFIO01_07020 [Colletotrichum fioriniae PJ7]
MTEDEGEQNTRDATKKRKAPTDTRSPNTEPTKKRKDETPDNYEYDGSDESEDSNDGDDSIQIAPRKTSKATASKSTGKVKSKKSNVRAVEARESLFTTTDFQWIDDEKKFHREVHSRSPKEVFAELDRDVPPITLEEMADPPRKASLRRGLDNREREEAPGGMEKGCLPAVHLLTEPVVFPGNVQGRDEISSQITIRVHVLY